jgi:very-short-patch-repair endonuclease
LQRGGGGESKNEIKKTMKYNEIKELVRKFRKEQTVEEQTLWHELRNRKLKGIKFLRQHAIIYENSNNDFFFFVPDFYCAAYKLAIELDGKIHDYQVEHDKNREMILKGKSIKTLRIKNEELKNIENVKEKICLALGSEK